MSLKMSEDELKRFGESLDALYDKHKDDLKDGDYVIECILAGIAELIEADKNNQTNPGIIACLESAHEGCRHAAMDYYASWK